MQERADAQLLREYAETGSDEAFRELVSRHTNLVYSAALRQLGSADLARDVAQGVFIDLTRKAGSLAGRVSSHGSMVGWLYQSTRFAVLKLLRDEHRRRERETQAMHEQNLTSSPDSSPAWESLRPMLDEAVSELSESEREALLLRFFQNRDLRAVGEALGVSEDAAQKRVARSLAKLRETLARKGVAAAAESLGITISAHAAEAAPTGLAAGISNAILVLATSNGALVTVAAKPLATAALPKALLAVVLALVAGAGVYETVRASRLREQLLERQHQQGYLDEQLMSLRSSNSALSKQVASTLRPPELNIERLRELLRLRGEVGVLRRRQHELEQTLAGKQPGPVQRGLSSQPGTTRAPFQVQLVLNAPGENSEALTNTSSGSHGEVLQVQKTPLLDYTALSSAAVTQNASTGAPEIDIEFSAEGRDLFAAITRDNLNKRLAIVLDGQVFSAPVIRSEITGGKAQITGNFTAKEAEELAAKINAAIAPR